MQFASVRIQSLGPEELVIQALTFLQKGDLVSALHYALTLATLYRAKNPESYALCAHILTLQKNTSAALDFWDKAQAYSPRRTDWIEKAILTALADVSNNGERADDYLALLGNFFITHPSPALLQNLSEKGTPLEGSVGIHADHLRGWAWLPKGENIRFAASPSAPHLPPGNIRSTAFGAHILHEIDIPLAEHKSPYKLSVTASSRHIHGSPLICSPLSSASPSSLSPLLTKKKTPSMPACTVVIPCYDGYRETLSCIASVFASLKHNTTRVLVMLVWDNGPNADLYKKLQRLTVRKNCSLFTTPCNMGFLASVNFALARIPQGDCILLNADTLVHGDWIDRMMQAAKGSDCATVTAMGSDAELVSYPSPNFRGKISSLRQVRILDTACKNLPPSLHKKEIPVGVGFCMLLTRKALSLLHGLNGTMLFKGYGEECEFCLRASSRHLKNYAACNVYVGHLGGRSFGATKKAFAAQNNKAILSNFPDYKETYELFLREDPLSTVREQISLNALQAYSDTLHVFPMSWQHAAPEPRPEDSTHPFSTACFILPCGSISMVLLRILTPIELEDISLALPQDAKNLMTLIKRLNIRHIRLNGKPSVHAHLTKCLETHPDISVTYESSAEIPSLAFPKEPASVFVLPPLGVNTLRQLASLAKKHPSLIFYMHKLRFIWRTTLMPENICHAPEMEDLRPLNLSAVLAVEPVSPPLLKAWRTWLDAREIPDIPLGSLPMDNEDPNDTENVA